MSERETARDKLVELLTTEMIGPNKAQTVTGHKLDAIEGLAPIVYVGSAGTLRERLTFTKDQAGFFFEIIIYVQQAIGTWTHADACDMVDTLEELLAQVVETYRGTDEWDIIEYTDRSTIEELALGTGGNRYYKEIVPIFVKLA